MAVGAAYPAVKLAGTPWIGKTVLHQPKCKCCADDVSAELLELLVKRAAGRKVPGVHLTLRGLVDYFASSDRGFSKQSLIGHMSNHIAVLKLQPGGEVTPAPGKAAIKHRDREKAAKEAELRRKVAEDPDMAPSEDSVTRGPHVVYLEKVVRIAAHAVDTYPERITPEMGIRAAAEIAKLRVNDSREALIDLLVATGSAKPAGHVGFPVLVRQLDTGEEGEVTDAELV